MPCETAHLSPGQVEAELLKNKDDSGRARRRQARRVRNPKQRQKLKPANGFA